MPQFLQRPQAPAVPLREGTPQDETWLDKAVDLFTGLVGIPNPQSAAQQASGGPLSNPRALGEMVGAASPIVGMALKRAIKGAKALPLAIQQALPFEGGHQIVPEAKKFLPWLKQYLNLRQMTEDRLSGGQASDAVRQLFFANEQQQRLPGLREEFSRAGLAVPDDNELLWLDAEMKAPKPTKQPEALPRSPHAFDLPEGAREQLRDEFPGLDLGPTASRETPEDIARGDAIEEINRQFLNGDISEDAYRDQLDQAMPPLSGEISIYRPHDPTEAENLLRAEVVDSPFYGPVERRQADYPWKHQESLFPSANGYKRLDGAEHIGEGPAPLGDRFPMLRYEDGKGERFGSDFFGMHNQMHNASDAVDGDLLRSIRPGRRGKVSYKLDKDAFLKPLPRNTEFRNPLDPSPTEVNATSMAPHVDEPPFALGKDADLDFRHLAQPEDYFVEPHQPRLPIRLHFARPKHVEERERLLRQLILDGKVERLGFTNDEPIDQAAVDALDSRLRGWGREIFEMGPNADEHSKDIGASVFKLGQPSETDYFLAEPRQQLLPNQVYTDMSNLGHAHETKMEALRQALLKKHF